MKVLVLRFSSIGDIVLTTPVVRCLHAQLPSGSEVHFLCKKKFRGLLDNNPHISRVWTFSKDPSENLSELKEAGFDQVIDLQNNLRSNKLCRKLGVDHHHLNKLNIRKWIIVNLGMDLLPDVHIVDRYFDVVQSLGVTKDDNGLDYFFPSGFELRAEIASRIKSDFILLAIGGAHEGKRPTSEQWAEIGHRSDIQVVLVGGENDRAQAREIMEQSQGSILDLSGELSLDESAFLAGKSKLVVSGDTGMMHIASAMGARVISLWGCTVPKFGMYPYHPHEDSVLIEPRGLKKRPCSKLGNRCKYGMKNKCISHIPPGEVADVISQIIAEERREPSVQ